MNKFVVYVCGGRNFFSTMPGRKIEGVVNCWRNNGYSISHICGGDLVPHISSTQNHSFGAQEHHSKWYRKLAIFKYLIHSVSEFRDLKHDKAVKDVLINQIISNKPVVIWERSSRLHRAGLDVAKQFGIPYVLEWKDHLIPYKKSFFRKRAINTELEKNSNADYIVVESNILKLQLISEGIDSNKIIVALNAIDPGEFSVLGNSASNIKQEFKIDDDNILIGYLGSYAFYHDAERLVLAVNILKGKTSKKFKVIMVGNGAEYLETKNISDNLGLTNDYIYFKDGVPKESVPDILNELDIAVLPGSTDIICPIKVQEYMYMGLASVIPDFQCNTEVIEHEKDGILFEPGNENSLSNWLSYLIENNDVRISIGLCAHEKALNFFTWEKTWAKALNSIVEKT